MSNRVGLERYAPSGSESAKASAGFALLLVWGRALLLRLATLVVFVFLWHLAAIRLGNSVLLPTPYRVLQEIYYLAESGDLTMHVAASMSRLLLGFGTAVLVGTGLGLMLGLSRRAERLVDPLLELMRPISAIAWIPMALYIFGIGNTLPVFIIAYAAFFPVILNTAAGVKGVEPVLVRAARTMGVRWPEIVRHVILPASLPSTLTGVRLAASSSFLALIAAELIGAPAGLGFAIQWYGGILDTPSMMAIIVVVSTFGLLADVLLRMLQRRLTPWAPSGLEAV
jgi:ABC-type nitrate/sulfonate/bicarbonate transport system permease component